jgi:AcrR family transcriptional regulator
MTSVRGERGGLRELTRKAVQAEIASRAMDLFLEHGFDETTVEQIAAAVGMSGRSVFRYFPTKEDMVLGEMRAIGGELATALDQRPPDEPPWEALRRALDPQLRAPKNDGGKTLARATMMATTPSLRAAQRQKHAQWEELLVPGIARRLKGPTATRAMRARAITAAALACLDVAVATWTDLAGEKPLDLLLDIAIEAVRNE